MRFADDENLYCLVLYRVDNSFIFLYMSLTKLFLLSNFRNTQLE